MTPTSTALSTPVTEAEGPAHARRSVTDFGRQQFITWGILPFLLVGCAILFAVLEPRFASGSNMMNIARQLSFLGIVVVGQMLYLITGNYDLSNGATVALTSVCAAMVMTANPGMPAGLAVALGCAVGLAIGLGMGLLNAVLIAWFNLSSFIVTLGTASLATGTALMLSSGTPITGLPEAFTLQFGTALVLGFLPVPVLVFLIVVLGGYVLLSWTKLGRHAYAAGGNAVAAFQSGVNVRRSVLAMIVIGSLLASLVGLLETARLSTGEANVGVQYPLMSIVAAVLGGVALSGGEGRLSGAVMGALFIVVIAVGMDLIRIQSYIQEIALGGLLIVALLVDRLRHRMRRT